MPRAAAMYKSVQVQTCSPAELVLLLFDGAIRFAREASAAMESGDRARAGERIGRCHAVLEELAAGLDPSHAPELCENLSAVYGFCMRQLVRANLEQTPALLGEVVEALRPMRDGWAEVLGKT